MKNTALVRAMGGLVFSVALLLGSACGSAKSDALEIGPFKPSPDKKYETKNIPGLPGDIVVYQHSWRGGDEDLWIRYLVRNNKLLYVSRKFGGFRILSSAPWGPDPVVGASVVVKAGLESEVGTLSPKQEDWLYKSMIAHFQTRSVDSIVTENDMSYRLVSKGENIFVDYAKAPTMTALSQIPIRD